MQYELDNDTIGEFRWRLRAANGKIIATGEGYKNRADCEHAVSLLMDTTRLTPFIDKTKPKSVVNPFLTAVLQRPTPKPPQLPPEVLEAFLRPTSHRPPGY